MEVVVVVVVVGSTVVVGGAVVGSSVVVVSVAQQSTDITSYSGEKDKHLKIKLKKTITALLREFKRIKIRLQPVSKKIFDDKYSKLASTHIFYPFDVETSGS